MARAKFKPAAGKILGRIVQDGQTVCIFKKEPTNAQGEAMAAGLSGEDLFKQVGELREQLVTQRNHFREQLLDAKKADDLQAKLETAMGLLCTAWPTPDWYRDRDAFLNTISAATQCNHVWVDARNRIIQSGEICQACGAMRPGNQSSEAADHV